MSTATTKKIHEGRNIKRFREMLGIKQEALAYELIDENLLSQVSKILKVRVEAIKNFDEEKAVNIIANTFHDSAVANTFTESSQANFNCNSTQLIKL